MRFFRKSLVAALLLGSPLLAEASRWNPYQSVSLVPPSPPVVTVDANGNTLPSAKPRPASRAASSTTSETGGSCPTERPDCHGSPGTFALEERKPPSREGLLERLTGVPQGGESYANGQSKKLVRLHSRPSGLEALARGGFGCGGPCGQCGGAPTGASWWMPLGT